jgi:hypothetical protein
MKLVLLVVLYKKIINECKTIQSLKNCMQNCKNSIVFIWDNSPDMQDLSELDFVFKHYGINWEYHHEPLNKPLSYVYNAIIHRYTGQGMEYLILLDDDSSFDSNYFFSLKNAINKYPNIMLFLPTIKYKDTFVSPTKKYFLKGFYIKDQIVGKIKSKNISAINSGMVISFKYFQTGFLYDQRLKFYGTDTYFMVCYSQTNDYLVLIDYIMNHEITFSTLNTFSKRLLYAYNEMIESWKIIYIKNTITFILVHIYICIHRFLTSIKYRSFKFIFNARI